MLQFKRTWSRANQNLNDIAGFNQQILEARASGGRAGTFGRSARAMPGNAVRLCQHHCHAPVDGGVNVSIGGVAMVSGGKNA